MNPYNIGDRVWTPKRGFGVVTSEMFCTKKSRKWSIAFDADQNKSGFVVVRYPKRKNIESEEYGKMMVKLAEKIDAEVVKKLHEESINTTTNPGQCTADHVIADGKKTWDRLRRELNAYSFPKFHIGDMAEHRCGWIRKVCDRKRTENGWEYEFDSLRGCWIKESNLSKPKRPSDELTRPKFKVGDIVYYESKITGKPGKYEVTSVYPDLSLRLVGSQNNPTICLMADTELVRPWTPTKITHSHKMEELPLGGFLCENVPLSKFLCAGKHISGKDIIFEHDPQGIEVWYGIKGDDI